MSVSEESATLTLDLVPGRPSPLVLLVLILQRCNFNITGLSAHAGVDSFCCRLAEIACVRVRALSSLLRRKTLKLKVLKKKTKKLEGTC